MKIPKVNPVMLRELPDQTADILNRVIEAVNKLNGE